MKDLNSYSKAERIGFAAGSIINDYHERIRYNEMTTDELMQLATQAARTYKVHAMMVYGKLITWFR